MTGEALTSLSEGRRCPGLAALTLDFAALIEVVLNPGSRCEIGDEVELIPQLVQFLLSLFVEDQFNQRRIVTEVPHDIVIARA